MDVVVFVDVVALVFVVTTVAMSVVLVDTVVFVMNTGAVERTLTLVEVLVFDSEDVDAE